MGTVWRNWQLYLILLPALIYIAVICYVPMYGIIIAFKDYSPVLGISGSPNIGFENFKRFFDSYYFWTLMKNTLSISVYSIIVNTPLPLILALMINEVRLTWFKKTIQTISYAPYFISVVVVVGMCYSFLNTDHGVINNIVTFFGGKAIPFMGDATWFKPVYVISGLWQGLGWWSIIYVATLANVDPSLHEAAMIDGASRLKRIWHINIPTLLPVITILFIMSVGSVMSVGFEKVYLMQNQMNIDSSDIIATYTYKVGLASANKDFSFATAVGLFNSAVNLVLLFGANFASKRLGQESLW